jgi:sugar phosphate permease
MLLALVLFGFLREPRRGQAEPHAANDRDGDPVRPREALAAVFRTPTAVALMLAFVCANFVATIFLIWTPTFLTGKFQFTLTEAGLTGAAYINLASAATVPLAGLAADRLSRRFAGGRIIVQTVGLLAGAGLVVVVGQTPDLATLRLALIAFGACKGVYDSGIFASLYDVVEPKARATAAGLMNTVGWGGGALGPLFVGLAAKYGHGATELDKMSNAIALGGVVYLAGAALLGLALLTTRVGRGTGAGRQSSPAAE